jgi:hypothetical protein
MFMSPGNEISLEKSDSPRCLRENIFEMKRFLS